MVPGTVMVLRRSRDGAGNSETLRLVRRNKALPAKPFEETGRLDVRKQRTACCRCLLIRFVCALLTSLELLLSAVLADGLPVEVCPLKLEHLDQSEDLLGAGFWEICLETQLPSVLELWLSNVG